MKDEYDEMRRTDLVADHGQSGRRLRPLVCVVAEMFLECVCSRGGLWMLEHEVFQTREGIFRVIFVVIRLQVHLMLLVELCGSGGRVGRKRLVEWSVCLERRRGCLI